MLYERENYYHKPVVNLNWFSKLSDKAGLYSVAYYSGGRGGGSGTYGSVSSDKTRCPNPKDWNATIAKNRASTTGASGVLRNSTNTGTALASFPSSLDSEESQEWANRAWIAHRRSQPLPRNPRHVGR